MSGTPSKTRVVVLISGSGSNLQALIEQLTPTSAPSEIVAVISNRPNAFGLERANRAGITTELLDHTTFDTREAFDQALQQRIDSYEPDIIVLAGFMRILSDTFVQHFLGKLINIHPSILPAYKGLHTHRRALEDHRKGQAVKHGCSVHFVTPALDDGPVIAQSQVPIYNDDTEQSLMVRVQQAEHQLYPQVVSWMSDALIRWDDGHIFWDERLDKAELLCN